MSLYARNADALETIARQAEALPAGRKLRGKPAAYWRERADYYRAVAEGRAKPFMRSPQGQPA